MTTKQENAQKKRDETVEKFKSAVASIQNSEQFRDWLTTRAKFRSYSFRNTVLIWVQRPDATRVAGYRKWQDDFNRQVRKGEKGITIFKPILVRPKPGDDDYKLGKDGKPIRRIRGFGTTTVFDVSQTEGDPLPAGPAPQEVTGSEHAERWPQLVAYAESLGFPVEVADLHGPAGLCRYEPKGIRIDADMSVNAQVATLVHELVHALGVDYRVFTRSQAETIAEGAAYVVGVGIGLDLTNAAVPYVAQWAKPEDQEFAFQFIDYYAACIEVALGLREKAPARPTNPNEKEAPKSEAVAA